MGIRYGDPIGGTLGISLWNLWLLGYPVAALLKIQEARCRAQESPPLEQAFDLNGACQLHLLMRDPDSAQRCADASTALSTKHGYPQLLRLSRFYQGWALIQQNEADRGFAVILENRPIRARIARALHEDAARSATFGGSTLTRVFIGLAEGCVRSGRADFGLEIISEALAVAESSSVRMFEAESWRLRGELTLLKDAAKAEEAEGYFRSAISVAGRQDAKSWELRATMSLARLLARQGKRVEARAMLAEIYGWFTEGFDTADLQDAKALIDQLSASR